ncbi:SDR family oxidoreductase [Methylobacter sp.]|uniref:dTDP-4-dehydrorhamnose reductase family protein n=1 Tax=Methylobacter sp. TaxID=2051955 RepID=UPI0024880C9E|nr:SDR family oxidoreductase [Methylobacter sp.]MDI1278154.1 SDR family oxidoreductase [Methylobacter sp.]MDI1358610.1 SDR family oxidoreductase [Methylobacter sp.]
MRVLVLGASGMIGSTTFRVLSEQHDWDVYGSVRSETAKQFFPAQLAERLLANADVTNYDALVDVFARIRPEVVINCVGATKHKTDGNDPLMAIPLNALLPHRLARLCEAVNARLVHVSTDCVFSGKQGHYTEKDLPDTDDVYGRSKALGEVDYPNAVTLRTSTIGHELQSSYGLLDWFLTQQGSCKGFKRAIFSGLSSMEFARVIRDIVIPQPSLHGLYHVAGPAIAKYDLLKLVAKVYGKAIEIIPENEFVIDRSLNADRFHAATGYQSPEWPELIESMHAYQ